MIQLLHGDCRDILPTLPEQSVQAVITSPPYFGLRDYGVAGQIGLEESVGAYVEALVTVFRLVWRVLRDDGTLWLNLGDSYANDTKWGGTSGAKNYISAAGGIPRERRTTGLRSKSLMGIPWRVALALQDDGWILRSEIIWHKPNAMPESITDRPTRAHEHLFLLAKNEHYYYSQDAIREPQTGNAHPRGKGITPKTVSRHDKKIKANESFHRSTSAYTEVPGGRNCRTVWTIPTQKFEGAHFATFPEALVEPCVLAATSPQACSRCGAPWARIYEATGHTNRREAAHVPGNAATKTDSTGWGPRWRATDRRQPTCRCAENDGAGRCVVLDPFAGTFTVGRVALRYGRRAIGIELNPDYCELADERTNGVQTRIEALL